MEALISQLPYLLGSPKQGLQATVRGMTDFLSLMIWGSP